MRRTSRIAIVTFGTRGDVLPFCVLGRVLQQRGHQVRLVTASDYHKSARRYGIEPVDTGEGFEETLNDPEFETLFRNYFSADLSTLRGLRALRHRLADRLTALMLIALEEIKRADLVVYNPFAYFAGAYAHELGRPALRVMCQPLLPSRRQSLSLIGGRPLGSIGNRLSYEAFRFLSVMSRRSFAEVRNRHGVGRRLGRLTNPLTENIGDVHHIAAYSPALSQNPGDWPVSVTHTGAWYGPSEQEPELQAYIETFLNAGPAPIYVGFGSMLWGAKHNTDVVLRALEIWGGRAILSTGPGGLRLPDWNALPKNLLATRHADHALLFPRVAAVVHHGGAGTTAAAIRAGRPNVILPLLGDQLFWGRRVAAVGAAEEPIPLRSVTPENLAGRIARACTDPGLSAAAKHMSGVLGSEPGVEAAADHIETLLAGRNDRVGKVPTARPGIPPCPITGAPAIRLVQRIDARLLTALWRIVFRSDPRPSFKGERRFGLWESPTGLYFFDPMLAGDAGFYARFYQSRGMQQYLRNPDRGEFQIASELIADGDRVLDVGCGFGTFRHCLAHASYTGLDPHFAGDLSQNPWARSEALSEHLAGHTATYDVACAFQVVEHVEDPLGLVRDMARAVKPGGTVFVGVPHVPSAQTRIPNWLTNAVPHHLTWWTESALKTLAAKAGLIDPVVHVSPWTRSDVFVYWMDRFSPVKARERHYRHALAWHAAPLLAAIPAFVASRLMPLPAPGSDEGVSLLLVAKRPGALPPVAGAEVPVSF